MPKPPGAQSANYPNHLLAYIDLNTSHLQAPRSTASPPRRLVLPT